MLRVLLTAAATAAAAVLLYLLCMGFFAFVHGFCTLRPRDRNFDPVHGGAAPGKKASLYRRLAFEGNRWWNTRDLQRCRITSRDGLVLRGALLPGSADRAALVVHGHRCCAGEVGFLSRMYHEMGFTVLAVDQRAHGKSEGHLLTMGQREAQDIADWADYLARRLPEARIVLHGCSMGAATVLYAGALPLPDSALCLISDCGYTSALEATLQEMRLEHPHLPLLRGVAVVCSGFCRLFGGFSLVVPDLRQAVSHCRLPALFLHGDADRAVPPAMSRELARLHPGFKQLALFEGAQHATSYFSDPTRYRTVCGDFISACAAKRAQ